MILTNSNAAKVSGSNVTAIASSTALFRHFMCYFVTTISAAISGTTGLIKNGIGGLTLSGVCNYTGPTQINAGQIAITSSGSTLNGVISGAGSLTKTGLGALTLGSTNTYSGGTLSAPASAGATFNFASNNAFGTGLFTSAGPSQIVCNATSTLTNDFQINAVQSLQFRVNTGTTILTLSGNIAGSGSINKTSTGQLRLNGTSSYTGSTMISGGILTVNNSYLTPSYTINSGAVLNLGYSPTASLTLLGNGTVNIVSSIAAIAPPFTISMGAGGLIDIKSTGGLSYGFGNDPWTGNLANLNVSGVLYIAANNVIVNALTGNSTYFTAGASTIIVGVNNGGGTYTGTLTRNYADASFRKEGSGTQTMNGTINLGATGTITQIGSGNLVINGAILSGSIAQNGTGTLTLTGSNTYTGATSISSGSIIVPKTTGASTATASFTTGLSVSFNVSPPSGTTTFRFFPGATTNSYASVTLVGVPVGTTATYTSATSTLSVIVP
jgi:autotransporter-associated beta strand protein